MSSILNKFKKYNLLGRGGASFPTDLKWKIVKQQKANKKYIICNASEGELHVFKDGYLLENYPEEIIAGVKTAKEFLSESGKVEVISYIYLRKDYYKKFKPALEKIIKDAPINIFEEPGGYLGGEETAACEAIEGKRTEPRQKPPFPCSEGLYSLPTLVNNTETFYCVAKIDKDEYKNTRFYSLSGDLKKHGVFELDKNLSIKEILEKTNNLPDFDFFVQIGGGASGEILLSNELDQPINGSGAIIVYNKTKTDLYELMKKWADFFFKENCDKCAPCREGIYRLREMIENKKIDKQIAEDMFFVLEQASFCALGKSAVLPFRSLINKLLHE